MAVSSISDTKQVFDLLTNQCDVQLIMEMFNLYDNDDGSSIDPRDLSCMEYDEDTDCITARPDSFEAIHVKAERVSVGNSRDHDSVFGPVTLRPSLQLRLDTMGGFVAGIRDFHVYEDTPRYEHFTHMGSTQSCCVVESGRNMIHCTAERVVGDKCNDRIASLVAPNDKIVEYVSIYYDETHEYMNGRAIIEHVEHDVHAGMFEFDIRFV